MLSKAQRHVVRGLLAVAALTTLSALSACSGGGGSDETPAPPMAAMGADRFGSNFGISFKAVANSDPREPSAGDIIPLSLTTDPLEVP